MCIDSTVQQIQGMMQYFETYKNEGFSSSLIIAKGIASDMGVEASFPVNVVLRGRNNLTKVIAKKKF